MNSEKVIELINKYVDGKLSGENEAELFNSLSTDEAARDYLRSLYKLKRFVSESIEEFPEDLEERIFRNINSQISNKKKASNNHPLILHWSYAAAVILLFISGYLFLKVTAYQQKIENVSNQIMTQAKTIDLLYNSFQAVEVRANYDNQIIIKPNI